MDGIGESDDLWAQPAHHNRAVGDQADDGLEALAPEGCLKHPLEVELEPEEWPDDEDQDRNHPRQEEEEEEEEEEEDDRVEHVGL